MVWFQTLNYVKKFSCSQRESLTLVPDTDKSRLWVGTVIYQRAHLLLYSRRGVNTHTPSLYSTPWCRTRHRVYGGVRRRSFPTTSRKHEDVSDVPECVHPSLVPTPTETFTGDGLSRESYDGRKSMNVR